MAVQYGDNILPDLKPFLDENLRLTAIPAKNKKKLSTLYYLAGKIEPYRDYTEPEINDILDDLIPLPNRELFHTKFFRKHTDELINRRFVCPVINPVALKGRNNQSAFLQLAHVM